MEDDEKTSKRPREETKAEKMEDELQLEMDDKNNTIEVSGTLTHIDDERIKLAIKTIFEYKPKMKKHGYNGMPTNRRRNKPEVWETLYRTVPLQVAREYIVEKKMSSSNTTDRFDHIKNVVFFGNRKNNENKGSIYGVVRFEVEWKNLLESYRALIGTDVRVYFRCTQEYNNECVDIFLITWRDLSANKAYKEYDIFSSNPKTDDLWYQKEGKNWYSPMGAAFGGLDVAFELPTDKAFPLNLFKIEFTKKCYNKTFPQDNNIEADMAFKILTAGLAAKTIHIPYLPHLPNVVRTMLNESIMTIFQNKDERNPIWFLLWAAISDDPADGGYFIELLPSCAKIKHKRAVIGLLEKYEFPEEWKTQIKKLLEEHTNSRGLLEPWYHWEKAWLLMDNAILESLFRARSTEDEELKKAWETVENLCGGPQGEIIKLEHINGTW